MLKLVQTIKILPLTSTDAILNLPEGFDLDLDSFLAGDQEIDEDDIFGKSFDVFQTDLKYFDAADIQWNAKTPTYPSLIAEGYCYRHVDAGIFLFAPDGDIVGGYISCDLSLDSDHQGQGLGTELVIERCLADGMNPVLNLDEAAYSSAGLAAHMSAWHRVRSHPEETAARLERLKAAK